MWPFSVIRDLQNQIQKLSDRQNSTEITLGHIKKQNESLEALAINQARAIDEKNERIRLLESQINEKDTVISSLQCEHKETERSLSVAKKDVTFLKDRLDFIKNTDVTPDFLHVEKKIRNRKQFIFIHGGAGTGKSTLIKWLKHRGLIHVVLAPTGLAALNVGGMTIHKAFGFSPKAVFTKDGAAGCLPKEFFNVLCNLKEQNIATICIDEISMVRADLLDAINSSLKRAFKTTEPFGGFQMVFVGDLFQLPPVVKANKQDPDAIDPKPFFYPMDKNYPGDEHGWKSPWFFDSDVLSRYSNFKNTIRINLQKVFRQTGEKEFVETLNQLRRYKNKATNVKKLNELFSKNEKKENSVIIVGKNEQADEYNKKRLQMIQSESRCFIAWKDGTFSDTQSLPPLPVPSQIELKIGEFVIIVANDKDMRYVNGTTGFITCFGVNEEVYVRNRNGEFEVQKNVWTDHKIIWNDSQKCFEDIEVGHYSQIPLIPGYAITCHKSQGKTLDNVYIDVQEAFAPGQMYVALSRTRSLKNISMRRPLIDADFPCDPRLSELIEQGFL